MRRFFHCYQFVVPAIGFPLLAWLWSRELGPRSAAGFLTCLVIFAYVVPGLGTNLTRLYEFKARWRWGRMRPHHGFVLATGAAALAWLGLRMGGWPATALLCAGLVTVYDAAAIRSGFIVVYNKPHAMGRGPWAIALDYAPVFFFSFGALLGLFVRALKSGGGQGAAFFSAWLLALMLVPVASLALWSWLRHGYSGLLPFRDGRV